MKKLSESIWSDLQDRSSGEITRKEDNVNNMDMESFWLYIIKNYKERVKTLDKDHFCKDYDMDIVVDPTKDVVIFGSYVKDELVRIMVVLRTKVKDTTVKKIIDTSPDNFRWIRINSDKLELALNDGEVTNQTFVDLIEFFLNNQQVFESIWSDLQDRSSGEVTRKEDEHCNIKHLKPIDMGGSVLWADQNLVYDGDELFTFHEAWELIKGSNWRLPTREEVAELDGHNRYYDSNYIYLDDDKKLSFKKCGVGYVFNNRESRLDENKVFYGWTSEKYKYSSNDVHVFVIDDFDLSYSPLDRTINDQVTQNADSKCCIRLVKDK